MSVVEVDAPVLPVVDLTDFFSGDAARRDAVVANIRQGCLDKGFLYVTGHGVPERLIEEVFRQTEAFFALPMDEKMKIETSHSLTGNRGYEPPAAQTLDPGQMPDLKESLLMGIDLPMDHPAVKDGLYNRGPNLWPDPSRLPKFKSVMDEYFEAMIRVSEAMMSGIALSLGLPETYFDGYNTDPVAVLRLLSYAPQPADAAEGEIGCGAHTDFGGVTLLLQDEVGGLQVRDVDNGEWVDAPPIPGGYVVNLGDMMERWTNDIYRSTMHRVINRSDRTRYSVPFFFDGNPEYVVECLPQCQSADNPPHYKPITVREHLINCFTATY